MKARDIHWKLYAVAAAFIVIIFAIILVVSLGIKGYELTMMGKPNSLKKPKDTIVAPVTEPKNEIVRPTEVAPPIVKSPVEALPVESIFPDYAFVYIHYTQNHDVSNIEALRANLSNIISAPPAEEKHTDTSIYSNEIRYFHDDDKGYAQLLAKKVNEYLSSINCETRFPTPSERNPYGGDARKGQLGLWTISPCFEAQ